MTDRAGYVLLAPGLEPHHHKLLRAAGNVASLDIPDPTDTMPSTGFVLSVGKAALDLWHDFGLIQVGANHGDVFVHRTTRGSCVVMVVKHPGEMAQMQFSVHKAHSAREDMVRDLGRWYFVMRGKGGFRSAVCGGCLKSTKTSIVRPAEHWVDELDGVGLCDDHWRKRGKYTRKRVVVPVKDRGKSEHQIEGQMEMLPGDGTRVMVSKN